MNQYFLIYINNSQECVIENGPINLPENYKGISGFADLEKSAPELLLDLTWAGILNYGFWKAVFLEKPSITCYQKITLVNTIDKDKKIVIVSYLIEDLTDQELKIRKESFIDNLKITRNRYFTQLPDAPISSESKIEFLNFRSQLRNMFEVENIFSISWPVIPSSANNINLPSFPSIPSCN
jgi:hypothetical protein